MEKSGSACFIRHPRTIGDLMQPHLHKHEREYQIVKTIELGKMDYENFITDMLADRQFIEDYADLCCVGSVWKCLFVHQRGKADGILIVPTDDCYVKYAAYISHQDDSEK